MNIKGAIFDLDGTIIDSMLMWEHTMSQFLLSHGITPSETADEDVSDLDFNETANYVIKHYMPNKKPNEIIDLIDKFVEERYLYHLPLKRDVDSLLISLKQKGVRLIIATASNRHLVEGALKRHGLLQLFDDIVTCQQVGLGKHISPLVFEVALEKIGTKKEDTLIFEDALYAVKTAKRAGFSVVGIYDEYSKKNKEQMKKLCDYYFDCWKDAENTLI